MAQGFLYDLPLDFYRNGCTTDGKFDEAKALALGYNEFQLTEIKKFLGEDEPERTTAPLEPIESEG